MHDMGSLLLALAVLLLLVGLLQPLAQRLALPITLLLAALGVGLGLLVFVSGSMPEHGLVGDVVVGLAAISHSADVFLLLFLPPLLFTAGLGVDLRLLREEIVAVLLLAVVAVVACTFVVGLVLAPFTEVGLIAALLLGAVIASTDPAAVVGLFKDIGAPRRLTTLVSGESLLNDAASISLFVILLGMVTGEAAADPLSGLITFMTSFGGGGLVGFVIAQLLCRLFVLVRSAATAAVSLSMAGAYLAFIVAEHYLHCSGVVAVVTASLVVAVLGPTKLSAESWQALHHAWEQMEYWANSLIFVLASMLAATVLPDTTWDDLWLLVLLIGAALGSRALVLYLLLPLMSWLKWAQPVGNRYKAVILWGGLRGAVTLVLALAAAGNEKLPDSVRHFVAVLATTYVLFTLFVQGPSLKPLLRLVGLDKLSPLEAALRDRIMALSRARVEQQVAATAAAYGIDSSSLEVGAAQKAHAPQEGSAEVPLQVGLLTVVTREKELYIAHFRAQTLSRRLVAQLVAFAERLHDAVRADGLQGYDQTLGRLARASLRQRLAQALQRRFGWSHFLSVALADRFEQLMAMEFVTRELLSYGDEELAPLLGEELAAELKVALLRRQALLVDALGAVEVRYPAFAQALRRQYLQRAALRLEARAYEEGLEGSLISREVFAELDRHVAARRAAVDKRPALDLGLRLTEMLGRVSLFAELPSERLAPIAQQLRPALAYPGDYVVRKGTRGTSMYFIVAGEAVVKLAQGEVVLKRGDFFGEMALLTKQPRNADVVARGFCHLLLLEARDFQRVLRLDRDLAEKIKAVAASRRS